MQALFFSRCLHASMRKGHCCWCDSRLQVRLRPHGDDGGVELRAEPVEKRKQAAGHVKHAKRGARGSAFHAIRHILSTVALFTTLLLIARR